MFINIQIPNLPPARKRYAGLGHHHRNWESEPLLEEREPTQPGSSSSRTAEVIAAAASLEKEKSKAMLSVESKLMKSIKEFNESDLSENSTPVNSPAPQLMAVPRDGSVRQAFLSVMLSNPAIQVNSYFLLFHIG